MKPEKLEIFKRQITKKSKRLTDLESHFKSEFSLHGSDFKISRKIYACLDGFVILRTFSDVNFEPFQFYVITERLEIFLKNRLPINTNEGQLNLYNLLKNSIGVELRKGQTCDFGSKGKGITIGGRIKIDGFQILIRDYQNLEETLETLADMKFAVFSLTDIQILENENESLKKAIEDLGKDKNPLIISEGKTDWKYFLSALRYFHSKNEFKNIQESWFLKFGSEQDKNLNNCGTNFILDNSVSKLNTILDSFIESRNLENVSSCPLRIGIFDSDEKSAKTRNDTKNNVYSFLIEPPDISTEFLFSKSEIMTTLNGRRLYIGSEFDKQTGKLLSDTNIVLGYDNINRNKAEVNKIIDSNVFDSNNVNIALTKEEFAKSVFLKKTKISEESWENFRNIFEKIIDILNKSHAPPR
jgi:hypothetical protein